ncbi:XdhC family protein [Nocardia sp. KC 131]|uniref:XdhC family protein n=1 Tax=Nocardia arseniciresistens TaxID=3392119 RepID=UPI00398EE08F
MTEPLDALLRAWQDDAHAGVATVVRTFSSSPRLPGAFMVVDEAGAVTGSISGGCVEGSVYETALEVRDGISAPALQRYGVSDDDAFAVGLTCGGTIDIFIQSFCRSTHPDFEQVVYDVRAQRRVAVATIVDHSDKHWVGHHVVVRDRPDCPDSALTRAHPGLVPDVRDALETGECATVPVTGPTGSGTAFVFVHTPPPLMLICGAVDFARALSVQGAQLGYRVVVCDARPIFATPQRFPAADEVVVQWPHRYLQRLAEGGRIDGRTVVCVLSHDPKFDDAVLDAVLRLPSVGYVGAMGSRRTHELRLQRLRERGWGAADLRRLRGPIGLDLGARTPEETAVAIAAQILADRYGRTAAPLADTTGPIHAERTLRTPEEGAR